jgi:hypothetical protein
MRVMISLVRTSDVAVGIGVRVGTASPNVETISNPSISGIGAALVVVLVVAGLIALGWGVRQ